MDRRRLIEIKKIYSNVLLDDIVPFWMKYSLDNKNGGYYHYLDRDGSILSRDKSVWIQGRGTWMFSKLYNTLKKNDNWLKASELGYKFLMEHCFDKDNRMFFQVTFDGKPLRKRRYWFSEAFAIIALAEYSKATGNVKAQEKAKDIYKMIVDFYSNPSKLPSKIDANTRPLRSHAPTMILISTSQAMREIDDDSLYDQVIDSCIGDLLKYFFKRDRGALLEITGEKGEIIDNPEGRTINPGHSIETSWFLMHEGLHRNEKYILEAALKILNWSLEKGWDKKYGGIFSFVDIDGKPPEKVEWDMKYWWPHCEALYALLLAGFITKEKYYDRWYEEVHKWTFKYLPDKKYGEWFGYLHRDGSICLPIKGSAWKGPFHIPRFLLYGINLINKIIGNEE